MFRPQKLLGFSIVARRRGVRAGRCSAGAGAGVAQPLLGAPLPDRRGAVRQLHQGDRHQDQPHRRQGRRTARAHQERRREQPGRRVDHRRRGAPGDGRQGRRCSSRCKSAALEARVPAHLRTPNWLAFSTRARVDRLQQGDGQRRSGCRPTKTWPTRA